MRIVPRLCLGVAISFPNGAKLENIGTVIGTFIGGIVSVFHSSSFWPGQNGCVLRWGGGPFLLSKKGDAFGPLNIRGTTLRTQTR